MLLVYEPIPESSVRNEQLTCPKSFDSEARLRDLLHFESQQLLCGGEEILTIAVHINFALA